MADILGYLALGLAILGYTMKTPNNTIKAFAFASACSSSHYLLLGVLSSAGVVALNVVRDVLSLSVQKSQVKYVVIGMIAVFWTVAFIMANTWVDFLPALAATYITTSRLYRDDFMHYRILTLSGDLVWLLFVILVGSVPMMMTMLVSIGANVASITVVKNPALSVRLGAVNGEINAKMAPAFDAIVARVQYSFVQLRAIGREFVSARARLAVVRVAVSV